MMAERLGLTLPEDRDFATAAGFALSVLRHLPTVGEHFTSGAWRFEVVDMDGRKIDKLLASRSRADAAVRLSTPAAAPPPQPPNLPKRASKPALSPAERCCACSIHWSLASRPRNGPIAASTAAACASSSAASWS